MAHLALQPGSRAEKLVQQQQQAGRSGGFAWLLGRKSRTAHDAAQLAARAFGGEQQRELTAETAQSMPRGWSGPSSRATAWSATEMSQPRGTEAQEEEGGKGEGGNTQLPRTDGFVVHHFKNGWYKGDVLNGVIHGHGHFAFANGESYEGNWEENRMSGRGKYTYLDGSFFEGEYRDGKKHGLGRYTPALGDPYMIYYEDGEPLRSGEAVVYGEDHKQPFLTTLMRDSDADGAEDLQAFNTEEKMGVGMKFALVDGGLVVSDLVPGGSARRDGRIEIGDRLSAVAQSPVHDWAVNDVLKLLQSQPDAIIQLEFDREIGDGTKASYTVSLERELNDGRLHPKSLLARLKPSRQLYQAPKSAVDDDSDDGARETQVEAQVPAEEEEEDDDEEEEEKEAAPVVATRRRMSMEEVCEEVRRCRLMGVQVDETMGKDMHKDPDSFFGGEEDSEEPEDAEDDDDLDKQLERWDQNGPATVPPEMVYIYISSRDMHKVMQDEKRMYAMTARILTECVNVLGCPNEILSIHSIEASLMSVSKTGQDAMIILGQQLQLPHQNKQYKPGDENFDKDTQGVGIRVGLLIHIRGTAGVLSANRVKMWQREKAEWLDEACDNHKAHGTWAKYSFLSNTLKIELAGHWDLENDCKLTREGTGRTLDKQMESIEETRAIWSQRFMRRYGNPLLMVLSQKERGNISSKIPKLSLSEIEMTNVFQVRKKLNVLEDAPRLFIIDVARRCIENRTVVEQDEKEQEKDAPKNKIGSKKGKHSKKKAGDMTSVLRKTLWFRDFKFVEPHLTRDERVTIKFKTMQRDYVFDFASPRDREVFMVKLKISFPENCGVFASTDVQVTDQLRPGSYTENRSAMRSNISAVLSTGTLPWVTDKFGNPIAKPENLHNFNGRNPHPDAELADPKAHASTCLIPPNALTPGLSNQQAAYVRSRPELAESFYGQSVYKSAMYSQSGGDHLSGRGLSTGGVSPYRGTSPGGRSPARRTPSRSGRSGRSGSRYLGDRSSVRSGGSQAGGSGKSPRDADIQSLKTLTVAGAGSVRGNRHGEVELIGGFSDADHVIAYKLLHKMSDDKQLTKAQVDEAVHGQFAEVAVKKRMSAFLQQQEDRKLKRKGIFYRKVVKNNMYPSKEVLEDIERQLHGLDECKRFRQLADMVRSAAVREELCFPLAFPVQPKAPKEEEQEEKEEEGESLLHLQMKSEDENSQSGSAVSGSQKGSQKSNASKPALRHRILGESFLEARPPNGDLLYDKYLILSRDTKEPLMTVRRRGGVVSFLDVDTGDEIGSFHVLQDNLWRCSMFGESEDFRVETNELSTGHRVYLLRRANLPDLTVSWKEGHIVFKTQEKSFGQMRLDPSQGKWSVTLDKIEEYFPLLLLWGAGCAVQRQHSSWMPKFEIPLALDFPKLW